MNGSIFKVVALSEVLMLIIALSVFKYLPAEVPVHWALSGEANNFLPKLLACLMMPIFTVLLALLFVYARKKENIEIDSNWYIEPVVLFFLVMIHISILVMPIVQNISVFIPTSLIVGSLFIVLGNFVPKVNYMAPERKRLSSFGLAKKCGYFMMFVGLLILVTPLIFNVESFVFLLLYLIILVLGMVYLSRKSLSRN